MNDKLKRWAAAGLMVIMLLMGFFAEYTHRHAMPFIGQTVVTHDGSQPSGKFTSTQISHGCFICQLTSVAVEIAPALNLAIWRAQQTPVLVNEFAFLSSNHFDTFLRRGPPAFLA
jgi:hypothetical protein